MTNETRPSACATDAARAEATFARLLPELLALASESLLSVNLNISSAVTTVLEQLPKLLELSADLTRTCTDFDARSLERLSDYAWALRHAHGLLLTATRRSCSSVRATRRPTEDYKTVNELQRRAFTLFFRTYNEVRAAVVYVRRNHGDAKELAPSLLGGARRRKRKKAHPETLDLRRAIYSSETRAPSRGSWHHG